MQINDKLTDKLVKDIDDKINSKFDELDEKLSPVVLYENTSGTASNNITLSDSAANYEYLEILCSANSDLESRCISNKIYQPDGKTTTFTASESYASGSYRYFFVWNCTLSISGTAITQGNAGQIQLLNQNISLNNSTNVIYITRVLGYK